MKTLQEAIEANEEYHYSFTKEITEILSVVDGKICGYSCTDEMIEYLDKHSDALITYAKRLKKKDDEVKEHEQQGRLF